MSQNGRIGYHISKREKRGSGNRAAGAQVLFIGVKAHRGRAFPQAHELKSVAKLRKFAFHEGPEVFDRHHGADIRAMCGIDIHAFLPT